MKNLTFYLGFIFILIFFGCKKENNIPINQLSQNSFFDSSVQYLKSQLSSKDFAKLNLSNKTVLRYKGKNIGVQIFEKNESLKKYLLLKNNGTGYSANWIDMSGLKISENSYQNGTVNLESINKETQINLVVKNNEIIQVVKTGKNLLHRQVTYYNNADKNHNNYSRDEVESVELPEIIIQGEVLVETSQVYTGYLIRILHLKVCMFREVVVEGAVAEVAELLVEGVEAEPARIM